MRTKSALAVSEVIGALFEAIRGFALGSSTERPRSTSKSGLKDGFEGTRDNAAAISCCSSAEGEHTFSMCTLTCGLGGAPSCARHNNPLAHIAVTLRIFRNTPKLYQQGWIVQGLMVLAQSLS